MNGARLASGAFAAFLLCSASPLGAQVVIGEDQPDPNVQVDWSVLERLGPSPTLPDMLKRQPPAKAAELRANRAAADAENRVIFHKLNGEIAPSPQRQKSEPSTFKREVVQPLPTKAREPADIKVSHLEAAKAPPPKPAVEAEVPALAKAPSALPPIVQPLPAPSAVSAVAVKQPPAPAQVAEVPPPKPAPQPLPPVPLPPVIAAAPPPAPAATTVVTPAPIPLPAPAAAPEAPQQLATLVPPPTSSSATASLPTDGIIRKGDILTVLFHADENQLPSGAQSALTQLAQRMRRDDSLTLQLLAYADGDTSNISKARRLSLSRALEVRKVLMDLGVRSTRIEVRALGNKHDGDAPIDRVDAMITSH